MSPFHLWFRTNIQEVTVKCIPVWKNLGHQRESFLQSTAQGLKCESAAAWFLETQTKCFQEALANFSRVPKHFSGRNFCGPSQNVVLGLNSVSTTPLLA